MSKYVDNEEIFQFKPCDVYNGVACELAYHNVDHIQTMINMYSKFEMKPEIYAAILFHDIMYSPRACGCDNETTSALCAKLRLNDANFSPSFIRNVQDLIMSTSDSKLINDANKALLNYLDLYAMFGDPKKVIPNELKIFKEYKLVPYGTFKAARNEILKTRIPKILEACVKYSESAIYDANAINEGLNISEIFRDGFRPKVGVYVGSFSPFHIGHLNIVKQAEAVFDKVMIIKAINPSKTGQDDNLPMLLTFKYECHSICDSISLIDILKEHCNQACDYSLIRGIRNGYDLNDEMNYKSAIRDMGVTLPIQYILSEPEFQHVSSTLIRSLRKLEDGLSLSRKYTTIG